MYLHQAIDASINLLETTRTNRLDFFNPCDKEMYVEMDAEHGLDRLASVDFSKPRPLLHTNNKETGYPGGGEETRGNG
jgi:hypothetical protein